MYSKIGWLLFIVFITIGCSCSPTQVMKDNVAAKVAKLEATLKKQKAESAAELKEKMAPILDELNKIKAKQKRITEKYDKDSEFSKKIKIIMFVVGCYVVLRMAYRPLRRMIIAILLRKINFKPRQIVPVEIV